MRSKLNVLHAHDFQFVRHLGNKNGTLEYSRLNRIHVIFFSVRGLSGKSLRRLLDSFQQEVSTCIKLPKFLL